VVALHPDQATERAVRAAIKGGKSFAVVPCCVFPVDGVRRSREEWLKHLSMLVPGIAEATLPMDGANVVLYWRANGSIAARQ
jgi:hypothetical protein